MGLSHDLAHWTQDMRDGLGPNAIYSNSVVAIQPENDINSEAGSYKHWEVLVLLFSLVHSHPISMGAGHSANGIMVCI